MLGKLRRLARSVSPEQARPDDGWASPHLTPEEQQVFLGMDPRDREHALRVTRHLLSNVPDASPDLVAAALLHDCGKSVRPYRVWERVLAGLVPHRLSHLVPIAFVQVRAHHAAVGARLVREAGGRPGVARLIERHHAPEGDAEAALLHVHDDLE